VKIGGGDDVTLSTAANELSPRTSSSTHYSSESQGVIATLKTKGSMRTTIIDSSIKGSPNSSVPSSPSSQLIGLKILRKEEIPRSIINKQKISPRYANNHYDSDHSQKIKNNSLQKEEIKSKNKNYESDFSSQYSTNFNNNQNINEQYNPDNSYHIKEKRNIPIPEVLFTTYNRNINDQYRNDNYHETKNSVPITEVYKSDIYKSDIAYKSNNQNQGINRNQNLKYKSENNQSLIKNDIPISTSQNQSRNSQYNENYQYNQNSPHLSDYSEEKIDHRKSLTVGAKSIYVYVFVYICAYLYMCL
jgi:hypothetical protein